MNFFSDERAAELRELFFESAQELLQQMNEAGLELEARPADAEVVRRVRRVVHTLKGDSAACGFRELSELAHRLEDALAPQHAREGAGALVEIVFTAADTFQAMLAAYRKNLAPPTGDELLAHRLASQPAAPLQINATRGIASHFDWNDRERRIIQESLAQGRQVYYLALRIDPASQMRAAAFQLIRNVLGGVGRILAIHPENASASENLTLIQAALETRLSKDELASRCQIPSTVSDIVIERAGPEEDAGQDLLDLLLEAEAKAANAPRVPAVPASAPAENTLRVDAARIDSVLNLIGELIIGKSMLHRAALEFARRFAKDPLRAKLADALAFQSRVLDDLQKSVMKIRMVPVEQLFRRFPRLVRDVAKQCGRDVGLELVGENTDLDKGILDALAEPLAHLVRNAIGHGIEPADERAAVGKPSRGSVRLSAYHQGNQVVIEVSDDGRGIDRKKLISRATERGLLSASEAARLTEPDALNLIFEPGLSTADEITQIAGRGVGMDAVTSALERLKGTVKVESRPGAGTTFQLMLPLTLASIQALLFRVAGRLYAIPLASVLEIARISDAEVHRVQQHEVFRLRNQLLALLRMDQFLPHQEKAQNARPFVIVIGVGERKFGLIVDGLMGEEELVIKVLDNHLVSNDLVSGASILGDGTVVLILNIQALAARLGRLPALGATA